MTAGLLALILVPFFLFQTQFDEMSARMTSGHLPPWVTAGAVVGLLGADVFLPLPSSVISAAAGALLGMWRGTLAIWSGMTAACLIGYAFGRQATGAARRFVGPAGLARAEGLMRHYGDYAIVICRPVPVLAEASVIFAGLVVVPFWRFFTLTSASNLGVALGYAAVGAFSMKMESFLLAFAGSLILPGLLMLIARRWTTGAGAPPDAR